MTSVRSPEQVDLTMLEQRDIAFVPNQVIGRRVSGRRGLAPEVRFRRKDVLAVLPARADDGQEATLIAMPFGLIAWSGRGLPRSRRTYHDYVVWDAVRLASEDGFADAWFGLRLEVGGAAYHAWLQGEAGRRKLRDFVVLVQAHRDTPQGTQAS